MNSILTRAQHRIKLPTKIDEEWVVEYMENVRWVKKICDSAESAWSYYYSKLKEIREELQTKEKLR